MFDCILTENRLSFSCQPPQQGLSSVFTVRIIFVSLCLTSPLTSLSSAVSTLRSDGRHVGAATVSALLSAGTVQRVRVILSLGGREGGRVQIKSHDDRMLSVLQNRYSYVLYLLIFAGSQINQFTSWEFVASDLVSALLQFILEICNSTDAGRDTITRTSRTNYY